MNITGPVKKICHRQGLAMIELAKLLNVTPQGLYASLKSPSMKTLENLSTALNVPIKDFFEEDSLVIPKISCIQVQCPHCGENIDIQMVIKSHDK